MLDSCSKGDRMRLIYFRLRPSIVRLAAPKRTLNLAKCASINFLSPFSRDLFEGLYICINREAVNRS